MNWKKTSEEIPELNESVLALIYIDDPSKTTSAIYSVAVGPNKKGAPWFIRVPNDPERWIEVQSDRVAQWTRISAPPELQKKQTRIDWRDDHPERIWKYTSLDVCEIILSDKTILFADPASFNDYFDSSFEGLYFDCTNVCDHFNGEIPQVIELLKTNGMPYDVNSINKTYEDIQQSKKGKSVITCFTLDPNNSLMWAHYGDQSNGVCLEFDNTLDFNEIFPGMSHAMSGGAIYEWNDRVNYFEDRLTGLAKIFLNKKNDWAYEKEYRYIAFNKPGKYSFDSKFLKGITFGIRCTSQQINNIVALAKKTGFVDIEFKKAVEHFSTIEYEKIY